MADNKFDVNNYSVAYWRMRPQWQDSINLYEPLPGGLSQYLFRYKSEDDAEFAERLKRLAQVNFVEYVINHWCSMLFSTNPKISCSDSAKEDVDSFVNNCNGQGDTLHEYTRDMIAPSSFLYGIVDVVVDLPEAGNGFVTMADEGDMGLRSPYIYIIPPLNRMSWALDNAKNYIKYCSYDIVNSQISAGMAIKDAKQYQEWTPDTVEQYDDAGNSLGVKDNPYGFVPIVSVLHKNSQRFFSDKIGISLIKDVVPLQKLIINLVSLIFDYHEQTNFTHRVIIQDMDNGADEEAPTQAEALAMSAHRVTRLPGKGSRLDLLTPDPAGVESMHNLLSKMVELLFLSCGLASDYGQNKTHQSEATVRANNTGVFNRLGVMARQFEKADKKIIETALRVQGYDDADIVEAAVTVEWDTNFSYAPFMNAIEELTALKAVIGDISTTAIKEFAKATIAPKLGTSKDWDTITEEIEAYDGPAAPVAPFAAPVNPDMPPNAALSKAAAVESPTDKEDNSPVES